MQKMMEERLKVDSESRVWGVKWKEKDSNGNKEKQTEKK
jgi:hypothetical protein